MSTACWLAVVVGCHFASLSPALLHSQAIQVNSRFISVPEKFVVHTLTDTVLGEIGCMLKGHRIMMAVDGSECQGLGSVDVIVDQETTWFGFSSFCNAALDC